MARPKYWELDKTTSSIHQQCMACREHITPGTPYYELSAGGYPRFVADWCLTCLIDLAAEITELP